MCFLLSVVVCLSQQCAFVFVLLPCSMVSVLVVLCVWVCEHFVFLRAWFAFVCVNVSTCMRVRDTWVQNARHPHTCGNSTSGISREAF